MRTRGEHLVGKHWWVVLAMLAGACSRAPDTTLTLTVASTDPDEISATHDVLAERFREFRPSVLSAMDSYVSGSDVVFRFRNGMPRAELLRQLYDAPGELRARLVDRPGPTWFTEADLADVALFYRDDEYGLNIRLTRDAAERVLELTMANVGRRVSMTLDERVLFDAVIRGVFSEHFEVTGLDAADEGAQVIAVVLRSGVLPARVRGARFEPPLEGDAR